MSEPSRDDVIREAKAVAAQLGVIKPFGQLEEMNPMMSDANKQARIKEVQELLDSFSREHLTPELAGYVRRLWGQIGRKRNYMITGGASEVWAAAVVYVVARLNFLFDRSNSSYLPPDAICGYFGTKKTTVSARAKEIEKACRIYMGQEGLCNPDISDNLTLVQFSNGLVLTKAMVKKMGIK